MNASHSLPSGSSRAVPFLQPSCERYRQLILDVRSRIAAHFQHVLPAALIRRAVDEAEQAALNTEIPYLVIPELAQEYVRRTAMALGRESLQEGPQQSSASAA